VLASGLAMFTPEILASMIERQLKQLKEVVNISVEAELVKFEKALDPLPEIETITQEV
jgi:hypothetical protein